MPEVRPPKGRQEDSARRRASSGQPLRTIPRQRRRHRQPLRQRRSCGRTKQPIRRTTRCRRSLRRTVAIFGGRQSFRRTIRRQPLRCCPRQLTVRRCSAALTAAVGKSIRRVVTAAVGKSVRRTAVITTVGKPIRRAAVVTASSDGKPIRRVATVGKSVCLGATRPRSSWRERQSIQRADGGSSAQSVLIDVACTWRRSVRGHVTVDTVSIGDVFIGANVRSVRQPRRR